MNNQSNKMNTKFVGHHVSSGGFIFYIDKVTKKISVLLIKNKKGEYWIPKGHIEEGENQVEAAFREIEEEVGLRKEQLKYIDLCHLYQFSFVDDNGHQNTKEIFMNVFESLDRNEIKLEQGETDIKDGEWLDYELALEKIMSYSQNELIKAKQIFDEYLKRQN